MPNANPFPRLSASPHAANLRGPDGELLLVVYCPGSFQPDLGIARATYAANAINEREGLLDLLGEIYARVRIENNALCVRVSEVVAKR